MKLPLLFEFILSRKPELIRRAVSWMVWEEISRRNSPRPHIEENA
jgi:hypothetical protein